MTSPIQPDKTYGVLHTENFFSFLGFAKKIDSEDIQKIDIYLNDKKIDTIVADEFIQKIDDMYDVENQAFTYSLPTKYMGQKATISFKNHNSQDELLNSPYTLIDKNHEKFNEAKFIQSLNEPISDELKNMYKPNTIGFLATKENMEDEEFVGYLKELIARFPEVEFVRFCFDKINNSLVNYIQINHIKDIILNSCVLIVNPQLQGNKLDQSIISKQTKFINVFVSPYNKVNINNKIKNINNPNLIDTIKNNLELFGLTQDDIKDISNNHLLMTRLSFEKLAGIEVLNKNELLELDFIDFQKINIKTALSNKKFIEIQKHINLILNNKIVFKH